MKLNSCLFDRCGIAAGPWLVIACLVLSVSSGAFGSEKCGSVDRVANAIVLAQTLYPEFKGGEFSLQFSQGTGPLSGPADARHTAMARSFAHDDGWFDILWRLCEDLQPMVAELEQATGRQFEVLQVKETFGGLRFYVNHTNDAIRQRIGAAAGESFRTCDVCGQPGKRREGRVD
jgi:hypothetical protein